MRQLRFPEVGEEALQRLDELSDPKRLSALAEAAAAAPTLEAFLAQL
ncbi:MAG: hypothetical protein AB7S38_14885 [Vulcanimicrobiota bacterium]